VLQHETYDGGSILMKESQTGYRDMNYRAMA